MKQSLLALAVLGAFAGAASAQSSVTIYGKLNVEAGKAIGTTNKDLMDVAGSRLGFRGVEDLGGGMSATFGMEHRFNPASGADATGGVRFWQGYSTVGLQGSFGHIRIGRDYTPNFLMVQNQIDPFGGDTQGALRGAGMLVGTASNKTGVNPATSAISAVRNASMIEYHFSASGFNLGAQIAGGNENKLTGGTMNSRAYSLAANYAAGPLFVAFGYENGTDTDDKVWELGGRYNFGFATVSAGYSSGTSTTGVDLKGGLIGLNVPVGAGDFKLGYAKTSKNLANKWAIGYHYNLSKRTKLFTDYARDSKALGPKTGYDFGIQHNF